MTMDSTTNFTKEQLAPYLLPIKRRSDRWMHFVLMSYLATGFLLAGFYDTWLIAIGVGGLSLLGYYVSKWLLPGSTFYQYVGSAVLVVFMAQFIYQMHGMFEMHFFAFVGCTFLVTYQNWRLQLPLIALIVVHHATFAYLQYAGADIYFSQLDYMDLPTFVIHAILAAVIVFFCGMWANDSEQNTLRMARSALNMEVQLQNIGTNIAFADEISRNNLKVAFQAPEGDELGKSLLNMRESLLKAAEREEQERFSNVGLARIADLLGGNAADLDHLCGQVIAMLVHYFGANQGGLFVLEGEERDDPHLSLKGCYAYERQKYLRKRVDPGEGLMGQLMLEKETIHLTDFPPQYLAIRSGLGSASPRSLVLVPLRSGDQMVGGIELASFGEFTVHQIRLLEKMGENIAARLLTTRVNARTQQLLEESREVTEQLRSQEEEMRQNTEELQATQEEMQRKEAEYVQRIAELEGKQS